MNEQTQQEPLANKEQEKEYNIIVNGTEKPFQGKEISFEQVVALAGLPSGPQVIYTVVYRRGHEDKPQGSMTAGDTIKVKKGMIFDVTATDKS